MSVRNQSSATDFFIVGFPGLQQNYYGLVGTVLFLVYFFTLVGNAIFLALFATNRKLHNPMYVLILNLAVSDVLFSTTTLPKIIAKYWFQSGTISFIGCFLQMACVHYFATVSTFILLIMALDRYVAICYPLRYPKIITNHIILILSITSWVLSILSPIIVVIRAYPQSYCTSHTIIQCFCDLISVTTSACVNQTSQSFSVLAYAMIILMVPFAIILLTYCRVIVAVLQIATANERLKIISTCSPQLIIVALYFLPRCFMHVAAKVAITFSTDLRIAIIMLYSVLPPMVNPLIYCLRTKEVKQSLIQAFRRQRVRIQEINVALVLSK